DRKRVAEGSEWRSRDRERDGVERIDARRDVRVAPRYPIIGAPSDCEAVRESIHRARLGAREVTTDEGESGRGVGTVAGGEEMVQVENETDGSGATGRDGAGRYARQEIGPSAQRRTEAREGARDATRHEQGEQRANEHRTDRCWRLRVAHWLHPFPS